MRACARSAQGNGCEIQHDADEHAVEQAARRAWQGSSNDHMHCIRAVYCAWPGWGVRGMHVQRSMGNRGMCWLRRKEENVISDWIQRRPEIMSAMERTALRLLCGSVCDVAGVKYSSQKAQNSKELNRNRNTTNTVLYNKPQRRAA